MTGPEDSSSSRPISVAELLARNGTIGSPPVGGRRRRRRGNADAVTVAELTGEIPVVTDEDEPKAEPEAEPDAPEPDGSARDAREDGDDREPDRAQGDGDTTPTATMPSAPPETDAERTDAERDYAEHLAARDADESPVDFTPRRPHDRHTARAHSFRSGPVRGAAATTASGAEQMSPDPFDDEEDPFESPVDLADPPEIDYDITDLDDLDEADEADEADDVDEDTDKPRSWLRSTHDELFGGPTVVDPDTDADLDADTDLESETDDEDVEVVEESRMSAVLRGVLVVGQCLLAVAFGAGMFLAFDQLWQWNSVVTLVLSMLVILGLVAGVRVVRKTEDITSTMIAVVVGALVTFGPLALQLQAN
ncbi:FUSC family protein [Mycolicibacterium thermoresistibile]